MVTETKDLKLGERPWRSAVSTSCCSVPAPAEGARKAQQARDDTVSLLKALADDTRLAIVRMLAAHGEPLCVCHITDSFELSQPTISHHLKLLRQAGLIHAEKRGLWAYYSLSTNKVQALASSLAATC